METSTILGYCAGFLTTVAFVPQVVKIWKARSAHDVSLPTFIAFTLGVALWLTYGFVMKEPPMILWNAVTLVLAAAILTMKVRFG
ncbi:MAG: SemiSWEET transporter [Burkholderiales bacterium]|nr:SemiSWEET transporter [Burkholderiales bacterium]